MDRTLVSGTEDLGSTPSGSAICFWHISKFVYKDTYEFRFTSDIKKQTGSPPYF